MATTTTTTNKPLNPRAQDLSPKGYNRANIFSGKALDFDGVNDYVDCGTLDITGYTGISISTNLKLANTTDVLRFVSLQHSGIDDVRIAQNGDTIFFTLDDGTSHSVETPTLTESEWNKLDMTFDGTTLKGYVNGVSIGSIAASFDFSTASGLLTLFKHSAAAQYAEGAMSGVKIFNTALTPAQVSDLYLNPEKIVPDGVASSALKLWLPMMEGAGTTAYDGSLSGFLEDIVTGFTNGTTYPLDSFVSSGDDITTAIKTSGFGGCVSNGHYYTNGQKVKVKFTYQKNSGNDLRVLFSSQVTGAGTAKSDIQNVSASGEFEHTFTMTADGIAYLQLGTGNASHSIDAVITDVYVSPNVSANHGTINGATWTAGIGAPVAQTALVSWNKGTNLVQYSEQFDNAAWTKISTTITANVTTSPDGTQNADKLVESATSAIHYCETTVSVISGQSYSYSVYAKQGERHITLQGSAPTNSAYATFNLSTGVVGASAVGSASIIDAGNDWYRCTLTFTSAATSVANMAVLLADSPTAGRSSSYSGNGTSGVFLWGASFEQASTAGPYVRTGATAQTSPVLLPQGLTANKDITGVNAFESARNAFALNLDGASWAEVHDNASLDITSAITLECWFYDTDSGSFEGVIGKWKDAAERAYAIIKNNGSNNFLMRISTNGSAQAGPTITNTDYGWIHLVLTYDGANVKGYKNGVYQSQAALTGSIATNDLPIEIGRYGQSTGSQYDNQLANPRIYNRALTAAEVLRNYNADRPKFGL
jgi:hypothetical protein